MTKPIPVHELLKAMPPAKFEAAIRESRHEILVLLESVYNSVGFPKKDGRWSPIMTHDLEAVRQAVMHPKKRKVEP